MFYLTITLYQTYVFLLNKNSISQILTNTIYNTTNKTSRFPFFLLEKDKNILYNEVKENTKKLRALF